MSKLNEQTHRIKQLINHINETFDSDVIPILIDKNINNKNKKIYTFELPSKKSDASYQITAVLTKKFNEPEFPNLENVLEIDFSYDNVFIYTNLNEIFYLFSGLKKIVDKFNDDYKYIIIRSTSDRLSLYAKALSKLPKLELYNKQNNFIIYKNLNYNKNYFLNLFNR